MRAPKNWPYPWKATWRARLRWWWFRMRYRRVYISYFVRRPLDRWIYLEFLMTRGKGALRWLDGVSIEAVPEGYDNLVVGLNLSQPYMSVS